MALKLPILWFIIIFSLAAFFRLFFLDLIEFKYDEAYTVFQLEQFYSSPYLMQAGPPQSTGVYNPPLFNYLMIFLSVVSKNPLYLSFIIALINSIFVVFFYWFVRQFYGNLTAIISSLILAVSPWNIVFSRKIWIPDLLLPFTIIFFYFFHSHIFKKNHQELTMFFMLALLSQIHASGVFFTIITLIIFLLLKIKVNYKKALLGFSLGLITALPYFFRQLTSNPFCIDCVAFLSYQEKLGSFDWENFLRPYQFLGGFNFQILLGKDYFAFSKILSFSNFLPWLFLLNLSIIIIAFCFIVKNKREFLFLPFYLILLNLFYFLSRTPSYTHYFVIVSPAVILLYSLLFKFVWEIKKIPALKILLLFLFALTFIFNIIFQISFYRFLSEKKNIEGDFGAIFSLTESFIAEQLSNYLFLPNYHELKSYAYMFAQTNIFHPKLAEYFLAKGQTDLAIGEFKKALAVNNEDKYSRANLALTEYRAGQTQDAASQIDLLEKQDASLASQIKSILKNDY